MSASHTYKTFWITLCPLPTSTKEGRKGKQRRKFLVPEMEDDEERERLKKKDSTRLGDVIAAIEEEKYKLLERQLVQESEI